MATKMSFGRWVQQRRKALALTQFELANQIGCTRSMIQKIERNARQPSRQMAELLAHHLELDPSERDAFLQLARHRPTPAPPTLTVAPSIRPFNNLPTPLTSLVGREWEVTTLCARLLEDHVRLLTITGPPGIGKTRLSLQVATQVSDAFPDGACFVALASLAEMRFVPTAIGRALGIDDTGGQPLLERIKAQLRSQSALLVLDNFEHLLSAAPLVVELLEAAAQLKILVTSRAPLQVYGEHEFATPPLAVPDLKQLPGVDQVRQYAAVDLFVQRARAVQQEFMVSAANAHVVAEICVRLDGLPLAIELAAARTKLFSLQTLLARLSGALTAQLDLLTGAQYLAARHRTLRNAIAWSYNLLNPTEHAVFRCLSVFAGGATFEALAAGVSHQLAVIRRRSASSTAHESLNPDHWLLIAVGSLVNQSLVIQEHEPDGEPRFTLLEMIREYALEQLEQHGEAEAVRRAHATYFVQLAEQCAAVSQDISPGKAHRQSKLAAAVRRGIELELDNLRTALRWVAAHDREQELRLLVAMTEFWALRRYLSEARQWLEERLPQLAAGARQLPPQQMTRCATLVGMRAFFTWLQGDFALAQTRFEESIVLWRQLQDRKALGMALQFLAHTFYHRGQYAAARAPVAESVAILRELGDPWPLGCALCTLAAVTAANGDYATAQLLYQECLAAFRSIENAWGTSMGLQGISEIFFAQGDDQAAHTCLVEALPTFRVEGESWHIAVTLLYLGKVAWRAGDRAQATVYWEESLLLARELGAKRYLAEVLCISGLAVQESGDLARARTFFTESLVLYQAIENAIGTAYALSGLAGLSEPLAYRAQLLGAAATVLDTARLPMDQLERAHYEATVAAVRGHLGEAAFAAAWAQGQVSPLAQAVADALGAA